MNGIDFGRELCGNFATATEREWLVTNGIGGYASGTVAGALTRRYQGLLIAALKPPLGRTLLVSKCEETITYEEQHYALSSNQWGDGTIAPQGFNYLERFYLNDSIPTWVYGCGDALIQKELWMEPGENTTYIRYRYLRGSASVQLHLKALLNYRDHHGDTHAHGWRMDIQPCDQGIAVQAYAGATPFYVQCDRGTATPAHDWFHNFYLSREHDRGLGDREDHLHGGSFTISLPVGETWTLTARTQRQAVIDGAAAYERKMNSVDALIERTDPVWLQQLAIAADQFIVRRPTALQANSYSILAGYPWFGDWGRDTMIALPGLTLTTHRYGIARSILYTFAQYIDRGMVPNRFPDVGEDPEYNTVDATLWYFESLYQYYCATQDRECIGDLYPLLLEIMQYHAQGTRYGIQVDPQDGLLRAGEPGVQLTWMDAKVGDWVVTPRMGKPVEVNALWFNALKIMEEFAQELGQASAVWKMKSEQVEASFQRFWSQDLGYCYDVLDTPEGADSRLRPNQILAVSLPFSPLPLRRSRSIVDRCAKELITSFGLRSLSPRDPAYQGFYGGGVLQRDGAYHQGTVWGWLLGPFAIAHFKVYGDRHLAQSFLQPMQYHLSIHGLGTMGEIFDGDPPHSPRGCYAQAWTVAEVLRAWRFLANQ